MTKKRGPLPEEDEETVVYNLRLPAGIMRKVREFADEDDRSDNLEIVFILRDYIRSRSLAGST